MGGRATHPPTLPPKELSLGEGRREKEKGEGRREKGEGEGEGAKELK
jgi:hypothetical protein